MPDPEEVAREEDFYVIKVHTPGYEQTSLRDLFKYAMNKLVPEWTTMNEQSQKKVDFELAFKMCDNDCRVQELRRGLMESKRARRVGFEVKSMVIEYLMSMDIRLVGRCHPEHLQRIVFNSKATAGDVRGIAYLCSNTNSSAIALLDSRLHA